MEIISPKMDVVFRELMEDDRYHKVYRMRDEQGKQEGRQEGEQIGQERGERIGLERGQQIMLFKLVANGKIDLQTASEQSGMNKEKFER